MSQSMQPHLRSCYLSIFRREICKHRDAVRDAGAIEAAAEKAEAAAALSSRDKGHHWTLCGVTPGAWCRRSARRYRISIECRQ
jgi:hypothetical protein